MSPSEPMDRKTCCNSTQSVRNFIQNGLEITVFFLCGTKHTVKTLYYVYTVCRIEVKFEHAHHFKSLFFVVVARTRVFVAEHSCKDLLDFLLA